MYTVTLKHLPETFPIVVVGCGGTGGFVAEGICRLLRNSDRTLILIDHDRVEAHNLRRQNFYEEDLGKFKAEALAQRLSRLYGRQIAYIVYPYTRRLVTEVIKTEGIVIGCVDNAAARKSLAENLGPRGWWIDAGNGQHSGQVLIGNALEKKHLWGGFSENNTISRLPAPSFQLPSLLSPTVETARDQQDCAEAVETEDQSPVINQAMATLVLEFLNRLLKGTLSWMGTYLDLEAGTLRTVPADPATVSLMCKVPVKKLVSDVCPFCGRRHD